MSTRRQSTIAIAFLQRFLEDRAAGRERSLAEYQAQFPGADEAIAAEYEAVMSPVAGVEDADLPRAGASNRYREVGRIGEGGMGTVTKVFDRALGRHVALKRLADRDEEPERAALLARFLHEAKLTARLPHPGIVPVLDVGRDEAGRAYYTMPLIEGQNLGDLVRRVDAVTSWPQVRILDVLVRVCEAVGYAHERGVIHRDLKPANIMVGPFGGTFVVDWGVAGQVDDEALAATDGVSDQGLPPTFTLAGDVVGTPAYMAPEQARGDVDQVGPRSDVYSLGAVLYFVLAGRAPYAGEPGGQGTRAVIERVRSGPPRPLREAAPAAAPALVAICERAMARAPDARYASAVEVAAELRAFLENRVVAAHRTGPAAELMTWVRRNRGVAAASASTVVTLIVAVFVSLALLTRADRNADLAQENFEMAFAAAEDLLVEFGERASANDPANDDLRTALVERSLAFYRRFAELRAADPLVADKVALSYFRIGSLESQLGHPEAAERALVQASEAYAALADRADGERHAVDLVRIEIERNLLRLQRGDTAPAILGLQRALATTERLLEANADDVVLMHSHGSALHNLAMAVMAAGELDEALALAESKIAIARRYVAAVSERPRAHEQLASGLQLRGSVLLRLDRATAADESFGAAVAALDTALSEFPRDRGLRWRRCEILNLRGVAASQRRQFPAAIESLTLAVDGLRPLVAANPDVREYVGTIAGALCNLGMLTRGSGDAERGLALLEEARIHIGYALAIDPTHRAYRHYRKIIGRELAGTCLALSDHVAAAVHTRELMADLPKEAEWVAAVMIASCATLCTRDRELPAAERDELVRAYGDEAMVLLRAAVERGTARGELLQDVSFDAIREREDFREVAASLR